MADTMLIPTKCGDLTTVTIKVAQRYYVLYKHHLTHNHSLTPEEQQYLKLYTEYFEKVSEAEYV